jgi:membrane associated rhomboid family serine protease
MAQAKTAPMTPWVTRLIALNGVVYLMLATVFTAPRFFDALAFDPAGLTSRPWTVLTYMFAHGELLPLALNTLVLALFGPMVERRLGGRRFLAYYLYCGIGAALFAMALGTVYRLDPIVGASAPALGISLAYVLTWPANQVSALQVPIAARTVFFAFVCLDVVVGISGHDGIAHVAHLGGALAGYAFFRLQALTTTRPPARSVSVRRPVVTPMRMQETPAERRTTTPAPVPEPAEEFSAEAVDRLLDKISEFGIGSLTVQERQALSDAAERKRREQP